MRRHKHDGRTLISGNATRSGWRLTVMPVLLLAVLSHLAAVQTSTAVPRIVKISGTIRRKPRFDDVSSLIEQDTTGADIHLHK